MSLTLARVIVKRTSRRCYGLNDIASIRVLSFSSRGGIGLDAPVIDSHLPFAEVLPIELPLGPLSGVDAIEIHKTTVLVGKQLHALDHPVRLEFFPQLVFRHLRTDVTDPQVLALWAQVLSGFVLPLAGLL
jgi:hypothetical protein